VEYTIAGTWESLPRHEIQALLRQWTIPIEELISNRHSITMASRKEWPRVLFISWMRLYVRRRRTSTPEGPRRCATPWYSWLVKHNRKGLPGGFKGQQRAREIALDLRAFRWAAQMGCFVPWNRAWC